MKIVPTKRQMPKPIKLLERIGNRENSALMQRTAMLWTNDHHFILLRSTTFYVCLWKTI